MTINKIEDITNTFYINLENRTDRKKLIEEELKNIGIVYQRFNAIKHEVGAIGCSLSHLEILENAHKNNLDHVLILEDDVKFLDPELFKTQLNLFFSKHQDNWDVVLFAGNNMPPYSVIDETCIKVKRCQTTTAYLVNGHYISKLMNNVKKGVEKLIKAPERIFNFSIDKYWFILQNTDNWFLITPPSVVQRDGYSDIEKKHVSYESKMLDLNKYSLQTDNYNKYS